MKKSLVILAIAAFSLAHSPTFAQDKKSDPAKEESKKVVTEPAKKAATDPAKNAVPAQDDAKKSDSADASKDSNKKKAKKGGC